MSPKQTVSFICALLPNSEKARLNDLLSSCMLHVSLHYVSCVGMCSHLLLGRSYEKCKMRRESTHRSHSFLLNITCTEEEVNRFKAGRSAIVSPSVGVLLLNDRDPYILSKLVIHGQTAVEVILPALV